MYSYFSVSEDFAIDEASWFHTKKGACFLRFCIYVDFDGVFPGLLILGLKEIIYLSCVAIFVQNKDNWLVGTEVTFKKYATALIMTSSSSGQTTGKAPNAVTVQQGSHCVTGMVLVPSIPSWKLQSNSTRGAIIWKTNQIKQSNQMKWKWNQIKWKTNHTKKWTERVLQTLANFSPASCSAP